MARTYYSKIFKQQALFEVANGEKLEFVLRKYGYNIDEALKKDKKYCSKLLYKWYKELDGCKLQNSTALENMSCIIKQEIKNLRDDNQKDIIMSDTMNKISQGAARYKKLKMRTITNFQSNLKKK